MNRIAKVKQSGTDIANMEFIGRTYRMLSKGYQNGDVIKYLYDASRRNTSIDAKNKNAEIINQYAYGYNKVNLKNYEQRVHDGSKGDVYAYDALNRIKNIKFDAPAPTDPLTAQFSKAKTYNLDKVDNILKIVENKNNVDTEILTEMTGANAQLNQYTKFDQWNMAYDANGNTAQKGTQQFSYNFRNQLVRSVDGGSTVTLKYDPFGRRIEKTGSGNTIKFYYAGNQVIEERNSSDQVTKQYVYGNGIDELLRLDVYSGATSTPYYFHTNDIGSTTAITASTGALVERVSYDTFGLPSFTNSSGQPIAASSIGNTILFQGREYDPELNLYNYRARYYDPIMGRFLQADPVGYQDSMNLYQGMNMNPGNFVDPMGLYGIDFHYYLINFLMRAKGWNKETANRIAGFSQYVDDNSQTTSMQLNAKNRVRWHFPGSDESITTRRDIPETRWRLSRYINDFKNGVLGADVRMGSELHVYADSWAHEYFTGYKSFMNERTNSFLRPYIGHADAGWGGHEPDLIPLSEESSQKAIEAAEHIYNMLPTGHEKVLGWVDVHDCLLWAFKVPAKPFSNREVYTNYVIFMMKFILQQKFGDFNINYNIDEMKKEDQFIDWSLGF